MTRRDPDRVLDAWLEEGPLVVHDRVIEAALLEITTTRQRGASLALLRKMSMNRPLAMLLGAGALIAAVVVVVLVGGGRNIGSPTATPTATPVATASATPAPTAPVAYPAAVCSAAETVALITGTPPQDLPLRLTEFRGLVATAEQAVLALPQDWGILLLALDSMRTGLDLVESGNLDAAQADFANATEYLASHQYGQYC